MAKKEQSSLMALSAFSTCTGSMIKQKDPLGIKIKLYFSGRFKSSKKPFRSVKIFSFGFSMQDFKHMVACIKAMHIESLCK